LADTIRNDSNNSKATCPAEIAAIKDLIEKIQDIIEDLPEEQKTVVKMRFFLDYTPTFKEIGCVIKKSEASARDYYNKALEFIRRRLDAAEATEKELYKVTYSTIKPIDEATYLKGEEL